jgi:hypothetical protein
MGLILTSTILAAVVLTALPSSTEDFSPAVSAPPGFFSRGTPEVYEGYSLYEYINGGADIFYRFGFKRCVSYTFADTTAGDEREVVVDVYDMGDPLNAFGIFRRTAASDTIRRGVGVEYVTSPRGITFWKSFFYVQVTDKSASSLSTEVLHEVAGGLADAIPGDRELPAAVSALPEKEREPNSEGFTPQDFLGRAFLKDVVRAHYQVEEHLCTLFVMVPGSPEMADSLLAKISEVFEVQPSTDLTRSRTPVRIVSGPRLSAGTDGIRIAGVLGAASAKRKTSLISAALNVRKGPVQD